MRLNDDENYQLEEKLRQYLKEKNLLEEVLDIDKTKLKKLKKIMFTKMYQHKNIVRKMYAGKQAIKGLYNGLMEEEKMLPEFYYKQLSYRKKHRVIADYIASMSDRYALNFYNEMYGKLLELAGKEFAPDFVAVACQDHGFIKGQSDRVTRFKYFEEKLEETRDPQEFFFTEKTGFFSRFDSIFDQLKEKGYSGFIMDSKVASICGILAYANQQGIKEFVGLDIGNGHTLGVSIKKGEICGLFEHHTRYLTPEKLKELVNKLSEATLTFEEVFNDSGHGAVVFEKIKPEKVLIAGPNRMLFKEYGDYAYPGGDVMITGCIGLYETLKRINI